MRHFQYSTRLRENGSTSARLWRGPWRRRAVRSLNRQRPGASAGFTLIELLVVLALIVILASIGLAQYRTSHLREGSGVEGRPVQAERSDRSVLCRQGTVSEQPRVAGQRRLYARHPGRSVHQLGELVADGAGGTGSQQSRRAQGGIYAVKSGSEGTALEVGSMRSSETRLS